MRDFSTAKACIRMELTETQSLLLRGDVLLLMTLFKVLCNCSVSGQWKGTRHCPSDTLVKWNSRSSDITLVSPLWDEGF